MTIVLWLLLALADRRYHAVTIEQLRTSKRTHVEVVGKVTLVKREGDGDWHIRLSAGRRYVICEIIPTLTPATPFTLPRVGDCARVRGIRRRDDDHAWVEVHPVESIMIIPCGRRR